MADIIVVKQNVAEKVAVNPAPVTITGATLVPATNATLGGIIVGDNLSITGNGVLSVANTFQPKLANTTYGLTDTGIPYTGYTDYYIRGEYVTDGLKRYYIGLRGEKETGTGTYYDPDNYAIGSYLYNANGTLEFATSVETDGSTVSLVSSGLTGFSVIGSQPGSAFMSASNATTGSSITLVNGKITGVAGNAYFELRGNNGGTGGNAEDYRLVFGHTSQLSKGITLEQVARKSLFGFVYYWTASGVNYTMTNGLGFDNPTGLGVTASHTSLRHTADAVVSGVRTGTEIRASVNNAELLHINTTPAYTSNSILTQGYADTRYQAIGAYLTSANLTFANLTGKPTTLAGYGITDGLTSANLTPYLTISSANATYSVLGHTHAIANVTGLQTALDAKLPSANFTYANLTGKPSTFAPSAHTHAISEVTGLQTALDGKSSTGANTFTGTQNLQDNELFRAKLRDYSESVSSPTISSGTLTLNLEASNIFTVNLNAAITTPIVITNVPASGSGASFTLIFTADGTPRSVSWPTSIKWAGGTPPTITSAIGKTDSFAFFTSNGGTNWLGFVGGQNF